MSRSGYIEGCENEWEAIKYRGQVASAMRGKRGQRFLRELRDALDAMPVKKLCYHDLQREDGACCALGAVGKARGIDMTEWDPYDATEGGQLAKIFDVANQLIREIEWENDESTKHWYPAYARDELGDIIREEKEPQYGYPVYVYKQARNAAGELIDQNGVTKEEFETKRDEIRWSRMRAWVDGRIRDA